MQLKKKQDLEKTASHRSHHITFLLHTSTLTSTRFKQISIQNNYILYLDSAKSYDLKKKIPIICILLLLDKRLTYFLNRYIVQVVPFFELGPSIQYPFLGTKIDRRLIFFLQIQLAPICWVPNGWDGWWSIFFFEFSQYPFLSTNGWSPIIFSKFQLV